MRDVLRTTRFTLSLTKGLESQLRDLEEHYGEALTTLCYRAIMLLHTHTFDMKKSVVAKIELKDVKAIPKSKKLKFK